MLLWAGQFVSQIGDRLAALAFPWLVYTSTGSAVGTGAVFAIYTLPYVLFGAFAGVAVDRVDKRRLMIAVDLIRAALVLTVPLLATRSLPAVYLLAFVIATAGVFFDPAKLSILPEIVPPGRLLRANSLMSTAENLTEIVGWAFAGLLLAAVSTSAAFELDAAHLRRLGGCAGADAVPRSGARGGRAELPARSRANCARACGSCSATAACAPTPS